MDYWIASIRTFAPKAPILLIGTHSDCIPKADCSSIIEMVKMRYLTSRYSEIIDFVLSPGEGIAKHVDNISECVRYWAKNRLKDLTQRGKLILEKLEKNRSIFVSK